MPDAFAIVVAFLAGAAIGSFLNVVVHRLPRGESLSRPRSRCPQCETEIAGYDNVPVLSWLILRGRCRHCGAPISPRYPAIELLTAVAFAAVVAVRGADDDLVLELPFVASLIALAAIDLELQILPNKIVYPMAAWGAIAAAIVDTGDLPEHLIAGAAAFVALLIVVIAVPGGMGMGDVKLAGTMGLYLGLSIAPAMLIAFFSGTLIGLGIIAREGSSARKKKVPFGVFLALGGIAGVLVGPELIELYKDNFLS
jgi:leader peptidase (prepilin peptidase) / N-methyltransferase